MADEACIRLGWNPAESRTTALSDPELQTVQEILLALVAKIQHLQVEQAGLKAWLAKTPTDETLTAGTMLEVQNAEHSRVLEETRNLIEKIRELA